MTGGSGMAGSCSGFTGESEAKNPRHFFSKDFAAAGVSLGEHETKSSLPMKKLLCLFLCLVTLAGSAIFAQSAEKSGGGPAAAPRALTKFNLDFPGGTVLALTAAMQKALGRPLNVVVPTEFATWALPPLKMNGVDAAQLFMALEMAGQTREVVASGNGTYQQMQTSFSFKTGNPATANDDSIWTFFVNGAPRMPKISRFYLLTPYLEAGLTVDDITTAVQTSWKMRGDKDNPTLSFHKETKLLIAVGDYAGLDTIDTVLKALDAVRVKQPAGADKPATEKKTKS